MIVPRSRLLFWVAAGVLPVAGLAGMDPDVASAGVMALAAFAIGVLIDAGLAFGRLDGIHVTLPDVVRFSKDNEGDIDLRIGQGEGRRLLSHLRLGLALPRHVTTSHETLDVAFGTGDDSVRDYRAAWPCTPRRRGAFTLDRIYLETPSALGFWAIRRRLPAHCEIRVYPNLLSERRHVAAVFLNRGGLGVHAQRQVGKGREFEQLRDYVPGDSYDEIDWKATARRAHPITKVFQLERTQEVYVAIDTGRLSARMTGGPAPESERGMGEEEDTARTVSQLERFITAALMLGLAADRQGDRFGLITFSNRVTRFLKAGNGKAHFGRCRDAIYLLEPEPVSPDFEELCTFLRTRLRRRALVVLLTNLDDPALAEEFVRGVDILRRQHLVLVNMATPKDVGPLFAARKPVVGAAMAAVAANTGPEVATVDDVYTRLRGHIQWRDLRQLQQVLRRRGVTLSLLQNEALSAELVTQYLNVKRRQIL